MALFHFKEFVIDQENCPMKINTDGVLLGSLCDLSDAKSVLDIGTGTGVIALMIAQRNPVAHIDAVDIDTTAFEKAQGNFTNSLFHSQLTAYHNGFKEFFELNSSFRYDLMVSNPPFYLNALHSPTAAKNVSKHTNEQFFLDLLLVAKNHLTMNGCIELVLPVDISMMLQETAPDFGLYPHRCIKIKSYEGKAHIRHIIRFCRKASETTTFEEFSIYDSPGNHSLMYKQALKNFFTIF